MTFSLLLHSMAKDCVEHFYSAELILQFVVLQSFMLNKTLIYLYDNQLQNLEWRDSTRITVLSKSFSCSILITTVLEIAGSLLPN